MKMLFGTFAGKALLTTLLLSAAALAGLWWFVHWNDGQYPDTQRLAYLKLYAEILKAVILGVVVALASILIPAIYSESGESFARLKESKRLYSRAKTGLDYLPIQLSLLPVKEAAALIQRVHTYKHQAEMYEELPQHLKKRFDDGSPLQDPDNWGDRIYLKLFQMRLVLEHHVSDWDRMRPARRLQLLLAVKPSNNDLGNRRMAEMEKIERELERMRKQT